MLSAVPIFLQLEIFKKMSLVAFATTYRTSKWTSDLLDSNADKISIPVPNALQLTYIANGTRARITCGAMDYCFATSPSRNDFARISRRLNLQFFHFQEFHLPDNRNDAEIVAANANGILPTLRMLKFGKFITWRRCHLSMFRDALTTKRTKLILFSVYDIDQPNEDLISLTEIECCSEAGPTVNYLLDKLAYHVPGVKITYLRDLCSTAFTSFTNLVKRALYSGRKEMSISLEIRIYRGDRVELLAKHFPPPAKRNVVGSSIMFIYPNKQDNDTYFVLNLCDLYQSALFQFHLVQKPLVTF